MSLSRITQLFTHTKAHVAYLTVGDGGVKRSLQAALALIKGGVNMLELGMPFSDPIADGPIIQQASARSLAQGTTLKDLLWLIKEIRKKSNIPLIIFSYLNPLLAANVHIFLAQVKACGADGLLLVDCPLEESTAMRASCIKNGLDFIALVAPNTSIPRMQQINADAQGFLYYVCRQGTTGMRDTLPHDVREKITLIKSVVELPVIVGFGVSSPNMVRAILQYADGVVIGSLFVKMLADGMSMPALTTLARELYQP